MYPQGEPMYPPGPYSQGPPPGPGKLRPGQVVDIVFAVLLTALLVLLTWLGGLWTLFGAMATDRCSYAQCNDTLISLSYIIGWGGMLVAATITLVGLIKHRVKWIWPALGLTITFLSLAAFGYLMTTGTGT